MLRNSLSILIASSVFSSGCAMLGASNLAEKNAAFKTAGRAPTSVAINPAGTRVVRAISPENIYGGTNALLGGFGMNLSVTDKSSGSTTTLADVNGANIVAQKYANDWTWIQKQVTEATDRNIPWFPHIPAAVAIYSDGPAMYIGGLDATKVTVTAFSPDGRYVAVGGELASEYVSAIYFQLDHLQNDCIGKSSKLLMGTGHTLLYFAPPPGAKPGVQALFTPEDLVPMTIGVWVDKPGENPNNPNKKQSCVEKRVTLISPHFWDTLWVRKNEIKIFDTVEQKEVGSIKAAIKTVSHLWFDKDNTLYTAFAAKMPPHQNEYWRLRIWNPAQGRNVAVDTLLATGLYEFPCLKKTIAQPTGISNDPNSQAFVAVQYKPGTISNSDFEMVACNSEGKELWTGPLPTAKQKVLQHAFSADGNVLVVLGSDFVNILDAKTGKENANLSAILGDFKPITVALSPNGKKMVIANGDNLYRVVDIGTGNVIKSGQLNDYVSQLILDDTSIKYMSGSTGLMAKENIP